MMGFSKTVFGIDVGAKIVRAARIRMGNEVSLDGYAERPIPEGIFLPSYTKDNILDRKSFQGLVMLTLGTAGVVKGDVSLSIPDQVVKISIVELKDVPAKRSEILKFIKWKSKRFLPYDPEAAKIDFQLLDKAAMAVFAKEDVISSYEEALSSLSFRPRSVSTPSINLFNLFAQRFADLRDFIFVSVLEDSFAVIIVREGMICFYRSTEVGYSNERLIQEINSSIIYYTSEHPDFILKKAFLYAAIGDRGPIESQLSDYIGMDVESLRISNIIKAATGVDVEPYGPAVAAALGGK